MSLNNNKSDTPHDLVVNDKGLFGLPGFVPFVYEQSWNKLVSIAQKVLANPASKSPLTPVMAQHVLDANKDIQKLPVCYKQHYNYIVGQHFGIYLPKSFGSSSHKDTYVQGNTPSHNNWGYEHAQAILKHKKNLNKVNYAVAIDFNWTLLKKAIEQDGLIQSGSWSIRCPNPAVELGEATSYAIYAPQAKAYLASYGFGPLGRAELFQSRLAATRRVRGGLAADGYVVVEVQARLQKIVECPSNVKSLDELQQAIAKKDKEELQSVLEKMDIQQLKDRINVLETTLKEQGVEPAPTTTRASSKAKRM